MLDRSADKSGDFLDADIGNTLDIQAIYLFGQRRDNIQPRFAGITIGSLFRRRFFVGAHKRR